MSIITAKDIRADGIEIVSSIPDDALLNSTGSLDEPAYDPEVMYYLPVGERWYYAEFVCVHPDGSNKRELRKSGVTKAQAQNLADRLAEEESGMIQSLFDAINQSIIDGKSVVSIGVSSPELWKDIHSQAKGFTYLGSTPGGMATFCGVPIHFLVNKDGPAFTLEFA